VETVERLWAGIVQEDWHLSMIEEKPSEGEGGGGVDGARHSSRAFHVTWSPQTLSHGRTHNPAAQKYACLDTLTVTVTLSALAPPRRFHIHVPATS
jgi:hypothetical protein